MKYMKYIVLGIIISKTFANTLSDLEFDFDISGAFTANENTVFICSSLENDTINNSTISGSDGSETAGIVLSFVSNLSDTDSTEINLTISDNLDTMPSARDTDNKPVFKAALTITNPGTDSNNQMFKDKIDLSASPTQVNLSTGDNMYMNPNHSGNLAIKGLFDIGHMDVNDVDTEKKLRKE